MRDRGFRQNSYLQAVCHTSIALATLYTWYDTRYTRDYITAPVPKNATPLVHPITGRAVNWLELTGSHWLGGEVKQSS